MSSTVSTTATAHVTEDQTASDQQVLRLTATTSRRGISWDAGVVDNENMGKKSSKCCCIYNKPKAVGESSSESEESDNETNSYEKSKRYKKKRNHHHHHDHSHEDGKDCSGEGSSK